MTKKEIQDLMDEARAIFEIPTASKILKHRILEIKETLSERIDYFRGSNDSAASNFPDGTDQNRSKLKGVRFEISRLVENLWIPLVPDFPNFKVYDIIPDPVVRYITGKQVEEGLIVFETGLKFPGLKGRIFNISFEKHNQSFISGIISDNKSEAFNFFSPENLSEQIAKMFLGGETNDDRIEVIKMIIYHLVNSESFFTHVVSQYFLHWKPIFDNELLEKFANSMGKLS